jgi:MinD-like ATPase involved in chromosome partitioning or flagellar assembly
VVNRYNGRNELQREIYKHLENQLGNTLLGAAVTEDTSADTALASQQTLFLHHPQSPILRSIELLASQVASGLVSQHQADPQPVAQH